MPFYIILKKFPGEWARYLYAKERFISKQKLLGLNSHGKMFDYDDFEYAMEIEIGTPPQTITVIPDTGSHVLWVADTDCAKPCDIIKNATKFSYDQSTTYEKDGHYMEVDYGSGNVTGIFGVDTVSVYLLRLKC